MCDVGGLTDRPRKDRTEATGTYLETAKQNRTAREVG